MTNEELQLLEARWRLREIAASDLHGIADELLSRGEDDQALVDLLALDRDELRWTGAKVFESLLQRLGGGAVSESEAVEIVLRDLARRVLDGTLPPLEATSRADVINVRTGHQYDALLRWSFLHEELVEGFAVEADVISLARSTVEERS